MAGRLRSRFPILPGRASTTRTRLRYDATFRSYKRIDGTFDLPVDATLTSVEAHVLERGAIKVRRTAEPD